MVAFVVLFLDRLSRELHGTLCSLLTGFMGPLARSIFNVTMHLLAPELTENSIRAALQQGHAFVSHDWMCDATGFSLVLSAPATAIMGDEVKSAAGQKLLAQFPSSCRIRLIQDGKAVADQEGDHLEYAVAGPGVYRVEGWLKLDGEDRPWIYSNPIYVR
jgi:hypothetical protein